jgi:uncharacterized membrane protein (TIGR02234 family)
VKRYRLFALALLLDVIGAAGALVLAVRHWQTVTTPRPAPLHDDVLQLSGRTVDSAPTALALVALAGVVAVLATRGLVRRIVGGVIALAGVGLVWRAIAATGAVSTARARTLVGEQHRTVDLTGVAPHVGTHGLWAALTMVCGGLVLAAGALIAARGHRWQSMSARYTTPSDPARDQARAATNLWSALDRGEDPTQ